MITADHGPAVSGAHNTIVTGRQRYEDIYIYIRVDMCLRVCVHVYFGLLSFSCPFRWRRSDISLTARAGKDLVSSLCSGLLTIVC